MSSRSRPARLPALPQLLKRKIYKTGQTRGADDDEVYQNRVGRNSTVLIPYYQWNLCRVPSPTEDTYEKGFIVLVPPAIYFANSQMALDLAHEGLEIGRNALVFYERRIDWVTHNPDTLGWTLANQRISPLGGQYVARVAATTATSEGGRINRGYTTTQMKGAGIRVYEYASTAVIEDCRRQLEALFWHCEDSLQVAVANGMSAADAALRRKAHLQDCQERGLLETDRLLAARAINPAGRTICPLCLYELSSQGFFERMVQAEGRAVHDLTITELNLFHVQELRFGELNHRSYNLGWGHHHCNVVVKDAGISETVEWMRQVAQRNENYIYSPVESNSDG